MGLNYTRHDTSTALSVNEPCIHEILGGRCWRGVSSPILTGWIVSVNFFECNPNPEFLQQFWRGTNVYMLSGM